MRTLIAGIVSLFACLFVPRAHAQTVVTMSLDDTFSDQVTAAQYFADAGVHGTFYVNSARLGQPSFLTLADVQAMQAAGNEIGGHTTDHLSLGVVPSEEEERQICDDRAALIGMGLNVTSLAYPHGTAPAMTQTITQGCGYNSARNSSGLRSHDPEACTNCAISETMPPANPYALRTPASIKSYMTAADLEQNVTDAEAAGGGWVPFVIHHVCDGCSDDAISPAVLQTFVQWVAARQAMGTTVKTVSEVVGGGVNGAINGPAPATFYGSDGNLLRNGDLESTTNTDGLPDCLEVLTGGANSNDYTVGITAAAHSGVAAAQIEFSPGKTGTPRFVSLQDLGYCSPAAKVGDQFVFTFYYQSSDPVAPVAYYRIASGWWKALGQGAPLPAAATWTLGTYTLPAIPADALAVSAGVTILTTGSLAVDDFMLVNLNGPPPPADGGTTTGDGGTNMDMGVTVGDGGTSAGHDGSTSNSGDLANGNDQSGCSIAGARATHVVPFAMILFFTLLLWRSRRFGR